MPYSLVSADNYGHSNSVDAPSKQQAANRAAEFVDSGMVVGLGSGSTSNFAVQRIAERIKSGELENIVGIPSSARTEKLATELGIPLVGFDDKQQIDITIDGADEVDPDLNLIKGGGGALLREKVVADKISLSLTLASFLPALAPNGRCRLKLSHLPVK